MLNWLRKRLFLSDHEWKKKNCPTLYNYLFELNDEERHSVFEKIVENSKQNRVCPTCHGIYWDETCPECSGRHSCGGYEIRLK